MLSTNNAYLEGRLGTEMPSKGSAGDEAPISMPGESTKSERGKKTEL